MPPTGAAGPGPAISQIRQQLDAVNVSARAPGCSAASTSIQVWLSFVLLHVIALKHLDNGMECQSVKLSDHLQITPARYVTVKLITPLPSCMPHSIY